MYRIYHFIFILVLAVSIIGCGQKASLGQQALDFTLKDLDGNMVSLSSLKGKVVILDFFATWCPPCREEIPDFVELQKTYANRGLQIMGISLDNTGADSIKKFISANKMNYPVAMATADITKDYGPIQFIPTTFILDKKGNIVKKYVGFQSKDIFEKEIKNLL